MGDALTMGLIFNLGTWEIAIILVFALLIFGRRLPEVGLSLGKGIVQFKKGLKGIEEDVETSADSKPDAESKAGEKS